MKPSRHTGPKPNVNVDIAVLRLPDHWKIFQGHFVVLWPLKCYFTPTLNTF